MTESDPGRQHGEFAEQVPGPADRLAQALGAHSDPRRTMAGSTVGEFRRWLRGDATSQELLAEKLDRLGLSPPTAPETAAFTRSLESHRDEITVLSKEADLVDASGIREVLDRGLGALLATSSKLGVAPDDYLEVPVERPRRRSSPTSVVEAVTEIARQQRLSNQLLSTVVTALEQDRETRRRSERRLRALLALLLLAAVAAVALGVVAVVGA